MFLVLRKEAFIQEMKKGINRGAAGVGGRRRSVRSKDFQEVFRQEKRAAEGPVVFPKSVWKAALRISSGGGGGRRARGVAC